MDFGPYAVGGAAARADSFSGLNPQFRASLWDMLQAADRELGSGALRITSAYRSPELQAQLYEQALKRYGTPEAARRWVAPPGRSQHNFGTAVDFAGPGGLLRDPNSREAQWLAANAERFGLSVPMSWEPWQVELAGARGQNTQGPQIAADAMRALGIERTTDMAQNEPTGGLLGRVSTQNRGSIWDRIGGGFLADPDRRARLAMALEGMTTNPNVAYINALQGDMQQRREEAKTAEQKAQQEQQKNATIAWLRSQGREDLADAMAAGLSANAAFTMALERAEPTAGVVVEGRLVNPVTGDVIYEPTGPNAADPEEVRKLRTEFSGLSRVKDFSQQAAAYGRVVASANDPSAAGDLALIFNYMKVLDPGSTVREGEFATAENSGGVDDRVRSIYNKILNGERLTPAQRNDFGDRATRLYQNAEKDYQGIFDQYSAIAERRGLPVQDALIDFRYAGEAFQPQAIAPLQGPAAPPPPPPAGITPEDWQRAWQNMTEDERTLFLQGAQ